MALRDRAASNSVHPGPEALLVMEARECALHAKEDVLQDIVNVGPRHAPRNERTKPFFELSMSAARVVVDHYWLAPRVQHAGPQHGRVTAGLVASIVAEVM